VIRVPAAYDLFMKLLEAAGMAALRDRLLPGLRGRVLEIGAGTGVNFPRYGPAARVVALDADPAAAHFLSRRADAPRLVCADAERLPFRAASFDAVVFTLVLCTVREPARAAAEARRVLLPGGVVVVLEHVRAPGAFLSRAQRMLTPAWRHVAQGCHLDRDTASVLHEAGFEPIEREVRWRGVLLGARWRAPGK